MKISWNWLREIIPVKMDVDKAAEILTDIGLEVESVERYESIKGGLEGLIVGEVVSCIKHPDADKLKITEVNTGDGILLHIVCGAPNVAEKQKVIVARIGTTIYPIKGDPVIIKKAKIRGVESEGMLCAEDEIGLSENHEGLLVLPDNCIIGSDVKNYFPVYSDFIFEIGLTANHADANSHFGVARELFAAVHSREIEKEIHLKMPLEENTIASSTNSSEIKIEIQDTTKCLRYSGLLIKNIAIAPSPQWMQDKLKAVGMRPINNIVDITNYILQELGQPLHAFDADKISGNKIIVKTLPDNTPFITLDEKERKLNHDDLMICDAEKAMCIAGVYGGINSGITENTKNIFLESACFNPISIRRTETRQVLKTDASSRFSKGTDIDMTVPALQKAAQLIAELTGAALQTDIIDIYPVKKQPVEIFLRYARLKMLSTISIPEEKIIMILTSLNIDIIEKNNDGLKVKVPVYKSDVTGEIDLIEEILRLYGYNHIPLPDGVKMPYSVSPKPDAEKIRNDAAHFLSANGFYEIFTNAISRSKYANRFNPENADQLIHLLNSLNAELDSMRQTLLFTGLEVITHNINQRQTDLKLYEFGKTYLLENGNYNEYEKLAVFVTGNKYEESWRIKNAASDLFDLKQAAWSLLKKMQIIPDAISSDADVKNITHTLLESPVNIILNGESLGTFGAVKQDILEYFGIRQAVYFAEMNWNKVASLYAAAKTTFSELPRFPEVRRDLALLLEPQVNFSAVEKIARKEGKPLLRDVILFDVYENGKENKKSYAFGLVFRDDEKTLTDKEVDERMTQMMRRYETELNAVIRK